MASCSSASATLRMPVSLAGSMVAARASEGTPASSATVPADSVSALPPRKPRRLAAGRTRFERDTDEDMARLLKRGVERGLGAALHRCPCHADTQLSGGWM